MCLSWVYGSVLEVIGQTWRCITGHNKGPYLAASREDVTAYQAALIHRSRYAGSDGFCKHT